MNAEIRIHKDGEYIHACGPQCTDCYYSQSEHSYHQEPHQFLIYTPIPSLHIYFTYPH